MTEKEMLMEFYDEVMNVVFQTSADYRMTTPKKGLEKEWSAAKEKSVLLKNMIERTA